MSVLKGILICALVFIASFALLVMAKDLERQEQAKRCVLTLELSQSHVSLNLGVHLKDAMNKCTFTIPVDREFYNSVNIGQRLTDKFRSGSFFVEGRFGSWVVKVVGKKEM